MRWSKPGHRALVAIGLRATDRVKRFRNILVATDGVNLLVKKLRAPYVGFVSSGVIIVPKEKIGFSKRVRVGDPDGHDLPLIQY
jgi:hypothetical protein